MKHLLLDNGRQIAYRFAGKKMDHGATPLVLLHGLCEESSMWDILIPHLGDVPIVAIDLPGFGQSDLPQAPEMPVYADAVATLLNALGIQRCVMVGHSLGGYVALEFASKRGDRLAGMGLFHSHPFADSAETKATRMRTVDMLRTGKRDLIVSQLFPKLFEATFAKENPDVVNDLISRGKKQTAEGIAAAHLTMISRADHQETLKQSTYPVLFLLGTEDALVPVDRMWQVAMLPDVCLIEIFPGVAHMGMFEAPMQCAAVIRAFFELSCNPRR